MVSVGGQGAAMPHTKRVPKAVNIDVFEYLDYRAYLRDVYTARRDAGRPLSFRAFSRKAQLRSPNYLKLVMDGERNLTEVMAERFADALTLTGDGRQYFVDLVAFTQATSHDARSLAYERLTRSRRFRRVHHLDMAQADYHAHWYLPAIRELVALPGFVEDPAWVAAQLVPRITKRQAEDALRTLEALGLLRRNANGQLAQTDGIVSTGTETRGLHIGAYHRAMLDRAKAAIELVPAAERDLSALTLALGAEGILRLKARLARFRRELLELSELENEPTQVVQVNFQVFPLSLAIESSLPFPEDNVTTKADDDGQNEVIR